MSAMQQQQHAVALAYWPVSEQVVLPSKNMSRRLCTHLFAQHQHGKSILTSAIQSTF